MNLSTEGLRQGMVSGFESVEDSDCQGWGWYEPRCRAWELPHGCYGSVSVRLALLAVSFDDVSVGTVRFGVSHLPPPPPPPPPHLPPPRSGREVGGGGRWG